METSGHILQREGSTLRKMSPELPREDTWSARLCSPSQQRAQLIEEDQRSPGEPQLTLAKTTRKAKFYPNDLKHTAQRIAV